ncbi:MAG TPA: MOSC N-terminal beta barrel domain-containing protein [Gaiellaceae bacterium]|nr:MOSC N-terminal beta barrel domain-containing protein [Gaiellaceae bacterium]
MEIAELWRYPVKSLRGERLVEANLHADGIEGDRLVQVVVGGRIVTSRIRPQLLGFAGTLDDSGTPLVDGQRWDDPEVLRAIREAIQLPAAELRFDDDVERFDVLPLTVATDGGIAAFGYDSRRLRSNIVVAGVDGLAEKSWSGRMLKLGGGAAYVAVARSRTRCVMTTFDPDTLEQDRGVLQHIVDDLDARIALDCSVVRGGTIRVGDVVELIP